MPCRSLMSFDFYKVLWSLYITTLNKIHLSDVRCRQLIAKRVYLIGEDAHVTIPIKIDALAIARKSTKIPDLMEVLKGCVQRQIHNMGRSVLSEFHLRGTTSLPETFHFKPEPLGHFCSIAYNRSGSCKTFCKF